METYRDIDDAISRQVKLSGGFNGDEEEDEELERELELLVSDMKLSEKEEKKSGDHSAATTTLDMSSLLKALPEVPTKSTNISITSRDEMIQNNRNFSEHIKTEEKYTESKERILV